MEAIAEKTAKILNLLIPEGDFDSKVKKIIVDGLKRKLTEYRLIENRLIKKYGMSLDEFERKNVIKEKGFSYEAESDYHEWDSTADAIKAIQSYIDELSE